MHENKKNTLGFQQAKMVFTCLYQRTIDLLRMFDSQTRSTLLLMLLEDFLDSLRGEWNFHPKRSVKQLETLVFESVDP